MNVITANSIDDAYVQLAKLYKNAVKKVGSKGEPIYSVGQVTICIDDPTKIGLMNPIRNLSFRYAAGETACLLRATDEEYVYAAYSSTWHKLAVNGRINSAYGKRISEKWDFCKSQLLKNFESKNAIIDMRRATDSDMAYSRDFCCTLALKFTGDTATNKLSMTAVMRSSDIWLGFPYDCVMWVTVLTRMAHQTQSTVGSLTLILLDSHVYVRHVDKIRSIASSHATICESAVLPTWSEQDECRLQEWLLWEDHVRTAKMSNEALAQQLYDGKFPRCLETLGAWLVTPHHKIDRNDPHAAKLAQTRASPLQTSCLDRRVVCLLEDEFGHGQYGVNTVINCNAKCDDKQHRVCDVAHAERMALKHWSYPTVPKIAYVTLAPCANCRRALEEAGVTEIYTYLPLHKASAGTAALNIVAEDPNVKS